MVRLKIFSNSSDKIVEEYVQEWRTENLDKVIGVEMTFKTAGLGYSHITTVFIEYNLKADAGECL